jgi:hypothetical protein
MRKCKDEHIRDAKEVTLVNSSQVFRYFVSSFAHKEFTTLPIGESTTSYGITNMLARLVHMIYK